MPESQKETVRNGYDKLSYDYRRDDTPDSQGEYAEWVACLAGLLPEGGPALDVGCGCGLPATKLLSRRFEVAGVDFSEVQIARARKLVPSARFIRSDISSLELPPSAFALIVSFYAIIHIPLEEHRPLFGRFENWLRPGGYLMAIVGHDAWTGSEEEYLGMDGGRMCWSHADEATYLEWITETGMCLQWKRFIPEGTSGHTLILARKPGEEA